jgi:hypothetical protein
MTKLKTHLRLMGACREAVDWVGDRELPQAWAECERADWMLWLCGRMMDQPGWPNIKQIVGVACTIAEDALPLWEQRYPKDKTPHACLEIIRLWIADKATIANVGTARRKIRYSWAAAVAAVAAAAVADVADAAAVAADAAAVAAAAAAVADVADAAAVAYDSAKAAKLKQYADVCRRELTIPEGM